MNHFRKMINSNQFKFQFKRATVQNYKSGNLETASYRISKTAWLRRDEDNAIEKIYQRVGDLTGLSMETSEELQVSNYGIGGHYEPHFDFARVRNRIIFISINSKTLLSFIKSILRLKMCLISLSFL